MTKADLIEEVSRVVEMARKESEVIVEAIYDSIVQSLRAPATRSKSTDTEVSAHARGSPGSDAIRKRERG